jgi:hypothetical protein
MHLPWEPFSGAGFGPAISAVEQERGFNPEGLALKAKTGASIAGTRRKIPQRIIVDFVFSDTPGAVTQ